MKKEYPDAIASEEGSKEHKERSEISESKIVIDLCITAIGNINFCSARARRMKIELESLTGIKDGIAKGETVMKNCGLKCKKRKGREALNSF